MRKSVRRLWLIVSLGVLALTGCDGPYVAGSGHFVQEERQTQAFETLEVSDGIALTVVVDPSQPRQVRVVGDDNLVALVRTEPSGTAGLSAFFPWEKVGTWHSANPLRVEVTMPSLKAISRSGGGEIDVSGSVVAPESFSLLASGGGTARVRGLDTESFNLDMSGSGEVTVEGRATQVTSTLSGGSTLQARGLTTRFATLSSSGGGSTELRVSDVLSVNASGGGKVHIVGNPVVTRRELSGGAELTFE